MSDVAMRTVGLGKMYRIGGEREKYRTLRDALIAGSQAPCGAHPAPRRGDAASREFWALQGC